VVMICGWMLDGRKFGPRGRVQEHNGKVLSARLPPQVVEAGLE
jgi:hypothetical protein